MQIEEERMSVVDKVAPAADTISEYDQVGQTFMTTSRSMMSSVASLTHGRYEVNRTDGSEPHLVSSVHAHVEYAISLSVSLSLSDLSLISCVCVLCVCVIKLLLALYQ